jgi:hypothetical protein
MLPSIISLVVAGTKLICFNNNHQIGLKLRGKSTNKLNNWDLLSIIKIQVLIPISFIFEWKRTVFSR